MVTDLLDMTLIKNRWTSTFETNVSYINKMFENLGAGNYIGAVNFTKPEE